ANSKDEDPTGLLNEGFRYRDIETGMWLSRDPAGFVDGPNLYAYVKQNPWTAFDPEGLAAFNLSSPTVDSYELELFGNKFSSKSGPVANFVLSNAFQAQSEIRRTVSNPAQAIGQILDYPGSPTAATNAVAAKVVQEAPEAVSAGKSLWSYAKNLFAKVGGKSAKETASESKTLTSNVTETISSGGQSLRYDIPQDIVEGALLKTAESNGGKLNMGIKNMNVTHATTIDFAGSTILTKTAKGLHAEQAMVQQTSNPWVITTTNNFCKKICKPMLEKMEAVFMKASPREKGPKVAVFPTKTETK
ncbi:RHS repeat-associated core domain-containing protein, partial [Prosthecobacter debontii]